MNRRDFLQAVPPIIFVVGGVGDYGDEPFTVFVGDYLRHKKEGWVFYITDTVNSRGERILLAEVLRGSSYHGQELFEDGTFINVVETWNGADYERISKQEWEKLR